MKLLSQKSKQRASKTSSKKAPVHTKKLKTITTKPKQRLQSQHKTSSSYPNTQQKFAFSTDTKQEVPLVTAHDVLTAYSRIKDKIEKTPLEHSPSFSKLIGANVYLKMESHNAIGSFKQTWCIKQAFRFR
eukprot:UN03919